MAIKAFLFDVNQELEDIKFALLDLQPKISYYTKINEQINALLKIKNRNDMFTTLDMCQINLSLAIASFAKYGACPTYILRNNEVIEISSQSLPVGIISPLKTSLIKYQLKENDIIFMITDGFISSFKELIEKNSHILIDTHPKEMNHIIMNLLDNEDKNDDMTLLTIKVCKQ